MTVLICLQPLPFCEITQTPNKSMASICSPREFDVHFREGIFYILLLLHSQERPTLLFGSRPPLFFNIIHMLEPFVLCWDMLGGYFDCNRI